MQTKQEVLKKRQIRYKKNKALILDSSKKYRKWKFIQEYQKARYLVESEVFTESDLNHIKENN